MHLVGNGQCRLQCQTIILQVQYNLPQTLGFLHVGLRISVQICRQSIFIYSIYKLIKLYCSNLIRTDTFVISRHYCVLLLKNTCKCFGCRSLLSLEESVCCLVSWISPVHLSAADYTSIHVLQSVCILCLTFLFPAIATKLQKTRSIFLFARLLGARQQFVTSLYRKRAMLLLFPRHALTASLERRHYTRRRMHNRQLC